jgi:hypothetical protein
LETAAERRVENTSLYRPQHRDVIGYGTGAADG